MLEVFGTVLPNWIMAATSVAAAVVAIPALKAYRRQVQREKAADLEAERTHARRAWASWVTDGEGVWGLLIRNSFDHEVHDFVIECVGNNHKNGGTFKRRVLPPGEHFVRSNRTNARQVWDIPERHADTDSWDYVSADGKSVTSLRFTHDSAGWRALPLAVSGRLSDAEHEELRRRFSSS